LTVHEEPDTVSLGSGIAVLYPAERERGRAGVFFVPFTQRIDGLLINKQQVDVIYEPSYTPVFD